MTREGCSAYFFPSTTAGNADISHRAPNSASIFVAIIIKVPIIPIFTILMGFTLLALEWPLPLLKNTTLHRSLILRPVFLLMLALNSIFFYQVRTSSLARGTVLLTGFCRQGTNVTIYALVAAFGYTRAIMLGEEMPEAKDNRGRTRGGEA